MAHTEFSREKFVGAWSEREPLKNFIRANRFTLARPGRVTLGVADQAGDVVHDATIPVTLVIAGAGGLTKKSGDKCEFRYNR
jgi:hypothetical protein